MSEQHCTSIETTKPTRKRIVGKFYKQTWGGRKGDDAIDCGHESFDATDAVLLMSLDEIHDLKDNSESTDLLGREHIEWDGPHLVRIEYALCAFFGVEDKLEITEEMLDAARREYEPKGAQMASAQIQIDLTIRLHPGVCLASALESLAIKASCEFPGAIVAKAVVASHVAALACDSNEAAEAA